MANIGGFKVCRAVSFNGALTMLMMILFESVRRDSKRAKEML